MALTQVQQGMLTTQAQYTGFKNRIINGAMVIDQRNAGASVTITANNYTVDRFWVLNSQASKLTAQQNAGSVTPPVGFANYLGLTSSSAYSVGAGDYFCLIQSIEGLNVADLAWGAANAKTVTLSFQVYSNLTGTFGGSLQNSGETRSYPFTYTVNSVNTWTTISVTIPGDTSGTWLTNNGAGIYVFFGLGVGSTYSGTANAWSSGNKMSPTGAVSVVGTSGATFYITGVQLEVGSTATSFDVRPYGTELALCQRYFRKFGGASGVPLSTNGAIYIDGNGITFTYISDISTMRSVPTATLIGTANIDYGVFNSPYSFQSGFTFGVYPYSNLMGFYVGTNKTGHGLSNTPTLFFGSNTTSGFVYLSAEL